MDRSGPSAYANTKSPVALYVLDVVQGEKGHPRGLPEYWKTGDEIDYFVGFQVLPRLHY